MHTLLLLAHHLPTSITYSLRSYLCPPPHQYSLPHFTLLLTYYKAQTAHHFTTDLCPQGLSVLPLLPQWVHNITTGTHSLTSTLHQMLALGHISPPTLWKDQLSSLFLLPPFHHLTHSPHNKCHISLHSADKDLADLI